MQPLALATAPARFPAAEGGAVFLRDVEDLDDADLDLVLADRLAESAEALRAAVTASDLVRDVARPEALAAHVFSDTARDLLH